MPKISPHTFPFQWDCIRGCRQKEPKPFLQNILVGNSWALQPMCSTARGWEDNLEHCFLVHVHDSWKTVWITEFHWHCGVGKNYTLNRHVSSCPMVDIHWPHTPHQDSQKSWLCFWIITLCLYFAVKIHSSALIHSSKEQSDLCTDPCGNKRTSWLLKKPRLPQRGSWNSPVQLG